LSLPFCNVHGALLWNPVGEQSATGRDAQRSRSKRGLVPGRAGSLAGVPGSSREPRPGDAAGVSCRHRPDTRCPPSWTWPVAKGSGAGPAPRRCRPGTGLDWRCCA